MIFMEAGDAGKWAAVLFPFLDFAFAIRRANDDGLFALCLWSAIRNSRATMPDPARDNKFPHRSRFCRRRNSIPPGNAAIATVCHAFHFDRTVQFANEKNWRSDRAASILDLVGVMKSGPHPWVS